MRLTLTDVKQINFFFFFFSNISGKTTEAFKYLYTYKQLLQAHIVTR